MKDENLKDKIEEAALSLFTKISYSKTSVEDIAHAAGIGKGTVYLYFASKEDIIFSIVNKRFEKMIEENKAFYFDKEIEPLPKIKKFFDFMIDEFVYLRELLFGTIENVSGKLVREVCIKYGAHYNQTIAFMKRFITSSRINSNILRIEDFIDYVKEFVMIIIGRILLYFLEENWDAPDPLKKIISQDAEIIVNSFILYSQKLEKRSK